MIGITLTSEQIRNAPAEVRRWIEQEVMTSMGQRTGPQDAGGSHGGRLAVCSEEQVTAILSQIQGVLPAVNVFFEFGRPDALMAKSNIEAFRLIDIAHHTRLQNIPQVIACLDIISQAFARVSGDPETTFCGFDREGHCFITQQTQQNILKVWKTIVASQQLLSPDQQGQSAASELKEAMTSARPVDPALSNQPIKNGSEANVY